MRGDWIRLATIMLAIVVITVGCVPLVAPPAQPPFPTGTFTGPGIWTTEYNADGSYVARNPDAMERGTYTVTGEQIVLKGDYCGEVEGTYTWTFDGEVLSFTAVDDQCVDRRILVEGGTWLRQP